MSTAPTRRIPRPSPPPLAADGGPGRARQKLRTQRGLVTAAASLIESGRHPTVVDVADAAGVSRRTAYRYFPTQAKLFTEAALESIRPQVDAILRAATGAAKGQGLEERTDRFVGAVQELVVAHEALLRSLVEATVLEPAGSAVPRRGVRRIAWIEEALGPGRAAMPRAVYERLVSAIAVCAGIEPLMVLRDIRGLFAEEAVDVSRWMARALVRQALEDARSTGTRPPRKPRR